jgi:hypothetical protein
MTRFGGRLDLPDGSQLPVTRRPSRRSRSMTIHLEATIPAAPERVYELLTNGAKLGEVSAIPAKAAYFSLFGGRVFGRQINGEPLVRGYTVTRLLDAEVAARTGDGRAVRPWI